MAEGQVGKICFSRIFEDEDLAVAIERRVKEWDIKAGVLFLIGTLKNVVLGYYKEGVYNHIRLDFPLEIASCIGNVAVDEKGEVVIHAHLVVSNEKAECFGGHLLEGSQVGATAELIVIEGEGVSLQRSFDEKTKLKLLKLG